MRLMNGTIQWILRSFSPRASVLFTANKFQHPQRLSFSGNVQSTNTSNQSAEIIHLGTRTRPPRNPKKQRKRLCREAKRTDDPTTSAGVLRFEIEALARELGINDHAISIDLIAYYRQRENSRIVDDVKILKMSSTGQGLAACPSESGASNIIVVIPFSTVGDIVKVQLGVHFEHYAEGHILEVKAHSKLRRDDLVGCKHFTKCSGCQLQMMSYQHQLEFKTQVVRSAYHQFGFDTDFLPIASTVGSPLQYKYRTKLTPHFNSNRANIVLGFESAGPRKSLFNVDSCSIATDVISKALTEDREALENIVRRYKNAGTILLRDKSIDGREEYTTNHTEVITQQINEYRFQFPAGEFFQNNNSILPVILEHIKEFIDPTMHNNIVDTYCGSGFFGISLSKYAERLIGIEISKGSLAFAQHNAELNNVKNAEFLLGSSEQIFKGLDSFNPEETIVILDPSRKGSNEDYLTQLSRFKPSLIVYVSCNVFSQARDLKFFCNETENGQEYTVETIRGYDFFPQTKHVESLAVLRLK